MKTTITQSERLQLLGLLTLGAKQSQILAQLEASVNEVIADDEKYSLLTDALYEGNTDIDDILKNMEITVTHE